MSCGVTILECLGALWTSSATYYEIVDLPTILLTFLWTFYRSVFIMVPVVFVSFSFLNLN
jgi:hypothetical protein